MAANSNEHQNSSDEMLALRKEVNQMKILLEQIAKSVNYESKEVTETPLISTVGSKVEIKILSSDVQPEKKNSKQEINVLWFNKLVEDSVEIPGLLDAVFDGEWETCSKILEDKLNSHSPEYREFEEIEDEIRYEALDGQGYMDTYYTSVIAEASKYSLIHLIAVFLKNEVSVNQSITDNKETMLHVAAKYGQYELVKLLLSLGAAVNAKNSEMETPLHLAADRNHPHIVELLLQNGANIDALTKKCQTPLMVFDRRVQSSYKNKNTNGYPVAMILGKYHYDRLKNINNYNHTEL